MPLGREAIVAMALDLLRAEGLDAVSMRRVAFELGTGPASLYVHVAGKEELLDLLYDEIIGTIPLFEPDPSRWREQATQLWLDSRDALARAGDIARHSLGRVPTGPNALRLAELTTAVLRAGDVPDQAAAWAVDVVGMFVMAAAVAHADGDDERFRFGLDLLVGGLAALARARK